MQSPCVASQVHAIQSAHESSRLHAIQSNLNILLTAAAVPAPNPYKIFYGMATPPTSYGGYGGNANEAAKYTFEYPAEWKQESPSKVGTHPALHAMGGVPRSMFTTPKPSGC